MLNDSPELVDFTAEICLARCGASSDVNEQFAILRDSIQELQTAEIWAMGELELVESSLSDILGKSPSDQLSVIVETLG